MLVWERNDLGIPLLVQQARIIFFWAMHVAGPYVLFSRSAREAIVCCRWVDLGSVLCKVRATVGRCSSRSSFLVQHASKVPPHHTTTARMYLPRWPFCPTVVPPTRRGSILLSILLSSSCVLRQIAKAITDQAQPNRAAAELWTHTSFRIRFLASDPIGCDAIRWCDELVPSSAC